jgi:hypothetical protein
VPFILMKNCLRLDSDFLSKFSSLPESIFVVFFPHKVKGKIDTMLAIKENRRGRIVVPPILRLGGGWI